MKPVGKIDLRAQVGDQLKTLIISGDLRPGEGLGEVRLADALGVSRTPVREALQVLHSEGFIEEQKKGYRVPGLSSNEAHEIYTLIGLIEGNLVRGLTGFYGPALKALKATNTALLKKRLSRKDQIALDRAFHETLIAGSENHTAKKVLQELREKSLRYEFLNYGRAGNLSNSGHEHAEIIKSLEAGSLNSAAKIIEAHWRESAKRLETALG